MSVVMEDIKYFICVCDTLNITRASEKMGISQPALSYAIKRLEHDLGGQLLIRLKNGVQLSKLGEEFQLRSRRLLYEWEQAQNLFNPSEGLVSGSYTFAIHPSVALYTLEHFTPHIAREFPSIDMNFVHGLSREMTEKVINWEADFGIVVNPIKHPDLIITKLCTDEVSIFHRKKAMNKLIYDKELAQSQSILKRLGKEHKFEGAISSGNLEVVAKMTALGMGFGLLPTRVANQFKNLQKYSGSPIFKDEICLIYRPEKHQNSISQKIIQLIKRNIV